MLSVLSLYQIRVLNPNIKCIDNDVRVGIFPSLQHFLKGITTEDSKLISWINHLILCSTLFRISALMNLMCVRTVLGFRLWAAICCEVKPLQYRLRMSR